MTWANIPTSSPDDHIVDRSVNQLRYLILGIYSDSLGFCGSLAKQLEQPDRKTRWHFTGRQRNYLPHISLGSVTPSQNTAAVWAGSSYTNLIDTQLHSSMRLISHCLRPMQVSWLPVLTNVTSPSLRHKMETDNMFQIIEAHPNWPMHTDVFEHPPPWLASWHPVWSGMAPVDTTTQWREDWSSTSVVNQYIVTDPNIKQPGFDLPHHTWSPLNGFRIGQGPCRSHLHK